MRQTREEKAAAMQQKQTRIQDITDRRVMIIYALCIWAAAWGYFGKLAVHFYEQQFGVALTSGLTFVSVVMFALLGLSFVISYALRKLRQLGHEKLQLEAEVNAYNKQRRSRRLGTRNAK